MCVRSRSSTYNVACDGNEPCWPVNTPEEAQRHLATIRDPIGLVNEAIAGRHVDDHDECISFLLEQLVRLAYRYDPTAKGARDFAGFAAYRLRVFGLADYLRSTRGRTVWQFSTHTYQREIPVLLSLDEDADAGGLDAPLATGSGDPATRSDPALRRLVADRASRRAEDLASLGITPAA
jgi:hypothetical protein